jgi:nucleoside-diphosphate-sugar epimerase
MRTKVTLITGASGEVGHALIKRLAQNGGQALLTLDLQPLSAELRDLSTHVQGDLLDGALLNRLVSQYEFDAIYHLAALLSTRSEIAPDMAHRVNVGATLALLQVASEQSQWRGQPIQFIFPSSVAVFGMPQVEKGKAFFQRVREWEWTQPRTMYGCNKLYCEMLGDYYAHHYRQLAADRPVMVDFRCVRFPGLISAFTLPSGGTSDYGPEMLHAAAQGKPYACFVRPDTRIPFMAMPDAAEALLRLAHAPREQLTRTVYNVTAFSVSAEDIRRRVLAAFPQAQLTYQPDTKRQGIVDSWPEDMDDTAARRDWGWQSAFDEERCFSEYLIPNIRQRYSH